MPLKFTDRIQPFNGRRCDIQQMNLISTGGIGVYNQGSDIYRHDGTVCVACGF
jgi:hypothetical protein